MISTTIFILGGCRNSSAEPSTATTGYVNVIFNTELSLEKAGLTTNNKNVTDQVWTVVETTSLINFDSD